MNVFELRKRLIDDYSAYVRSFISIRDPRIREQVDRDLTDGILWPQARIGLNPAFAEGGWIDDLVGQGLLHPDCRKVFRLKQAQDDDGKALKLHQHQVDAVKAARSHRNYVLTTGTGSGKSLAYIVPIVDHVLRAEKRKGIKAIVVYPMNALANSQHGELTKFLCHGFPDGKAPVTFRRYAGQESDEERNEIIANPPDILLTNYVMLELILTLVLDFAARQKVGGTHLNFFIYEQLPVLPPGLYDQPAPWSPDETVATWMRPRVLELTYTDAALRAFGADNGWQGAPFRWTPDRRLELRYELDAAFFLLYGLPRADAAYVLDTFSIVKEADIKTTGEYRTSNGIMRAYEALGAAVPGAGRTIPAGCHGVAR